MERSGPSRLVLGQVAVAEGSNEIPAIPERLALSGCIVTIGCQTASARAVAAQGADSTITRKEHQGNLFVGTEAAFAGLNAGAMAYRHTSHREVDTGHGRLEVRTTTLLDDPALLAWLNPAGAWTGLAGLARVVAERRTGDLRSRETRYSITSLTAARTVHAAVRSDWGQAPRRSGEGTGSTGCSTWPSARTSAASGSATAPGTL